ATLALLEERLFHSSLTQEDLDRLRQQQIEAIHANKQQPSTIASNVYRQLLYGQEHAYAVSSTGTEETLQALTLEDINSFRDLSLSTRSLDVVVVGNIEQQDVLDKLAFLEELPDHTVTLREQPEPPEIEQTTLYLIDKP